MAAPPNRRRQPPQPPQQPPPPLLGNMQTVDVVAEEAYYAYLRQHAPEGTPEALPTLGSTIRLPGMPVHAVELRWVLQSRDQEVIAAQVERAGHKPRYDALYEALQAACRQHADARMRLHLSVAYVAALDCCNLYYTGVPSRVYQVFLGSAHGLCFLDYAPDGSAQIDALPLWAKRMLREQRQRERGS